MAARAHGVRVQNSGHAGQTVVGGHGKGGAAMGRRMLVLVGIPVLLLALSGPASAADRGQPLRPTGRCTSPRGTSVAVGGCPRTRRSMAMSRCPMTCWAGSWPAGPRTSRAVANSPWTTWRWAAPPARPWSADQLPQAIAELQARNHDRRPKNDVKVITIDIGGNDVFAVVPSCRRTDPRGVWG